MKFTALAINNGDSFLLENEGKRILVDTGLRSLNCLNELNLKGIQKIDIVVITHYDSDHMGGLIELLNSNIDIPEVWLPDNFKRIQLTLLEDNSNLLRYLKNIDVQPEDEYGTYDVIEDSVPLENSNRFGYTLFDVYQDGIILFNLTNLRKVNISKIEEIVNVCHARRKNVKWLHYTGFLQGFRISSTMIGLNCKVNRNLSPYKDDLEALYFLSRINHESLVLKYHTNGLPEILFTADSGFEFLNSNQSISLENDSIVTAPHHGSASPENARGYGLIKGSNLIYVRSENSRVTTLSRLYINRRQSGLLNYCTKCRPVSISFSEVCLQYSNNQWNTSNFVCSCL